MSSRTTLQRRLAKLEGHTNEGGPEPSLLARHLIKALHSNRLTDTRYPATDREINLLAALCALRSSSENGEMPVDLEGVYELPSGAEIHWITNPKNRGGHSIYASGRAELDDLPEEGIRPFVERMAAEKQPHREERLAVLLERKPDEDPGEGDR